MLIARGEWLMSCIVVKLSFRKGIQLIAPQIPLPVSGLPCTADPCLTPDVFN